MNIECRGRNGWFNYDKFYVSNVQDHQTSDPITYISLESKRSGKNAPIQIIGPSKKIKKLLFKISNKIEKSSLPSYELLIEQLKELNNILIDQNQDKNYDEAINHVTTETNELIHLAEKALEDK